MLVWILTDAIGDAHGPFASLYQAVNYIDLVHPPKPHSLVEVQNGDPRLCAAVLDAFYTDRAALIKARMV